MKRKMKFILLAGFFLVTLGVIFPFGHFADASGESRIVAPEDGRFKAIRSVCDDRYGNLLYQSESKYVSPFDVVPGGCPVSVGGRSANTSGESRIVAPEEGKFRAIRAFCDLPTGNLVYESESSWVSTISVIPGGCVLPRISQPSEFLSPTSVPAPK